MEFESKCEYCGAKLVNIEGRRKKKFCNSSHRVYAHKKAKAGAKKKTKESPAKPEKPPVLPKIDPQPTTQPKTVEDLKKMIPANVVGIERTIRLAELKQQYGIK